MAAERNIARYPTPTWSVGKIVTQGIIGGIIAGIVMLVGEMLQAAILGDPLLAPATMIAAMLLGPTVLGDLSLPVLATGMGWHLALSAIFGVILAAIAANWPLVRQSATNLVATGVVYGTALWLVNFYVIAPIAGWNWFPNMTNPLAQFIVHAFFYGLPLGAYLSTQVRAAAAVEVPAEERRREAA